jgi:iron complex outermembrane receptor protein
LKGSAVKIFIFILLFGPGVQISAARVSDPDSTGKQTIIPERPPVQLQEVTIVAPEDQKDAPNSTISILPAAIQQSVASDSWDLLRQEAGLEVHEQGQGPGFASDASIRGFSSDHSTDIALYVDGVPVNEPVNGHAEGYNDFSLLFPQLIKSIEILKGPVSPLYGNFAMAGVVNVRTIERADSTVAWLTGGSNGRAEGSLVTGFNDGTLGGVVGIRGERDDGWRPNSGWQLGQLYGRLVRDFSDAVTLDGGVGLYASGWDSPGFLTVDQFDRRLYDTVTNVSDGGFKRRAQERLSLRVFATPTLLWRSTLYATQGRWQLFLTIPPEPGAGEGTGSQTEEEDIRYGYGATSALSWSSPWGNLTLGAEGRLDHADYENWFTTDRRRDSAQTLVSARQLSGALFFQADARLYEDVHVTIGGRYDVLGTLSEPVGGQTLSASKGAFSPKLGISYQLLPFADVYGNISRGFRQTDGVITDPSLPFITAWNYEAGIKFRNSLAAVDLAVFRMDVDNEQTFNPITLTSSSNGASRRQGVDITMHARVSNAMEVTSTWTFTDGKYRQLITPDGVTLSGSQIFNTAKYVGTLDLDVSPPGDIWQLRLGANFVGAYAPFDEPGVIVPSYMLFHLSTGVHVGHILAEAGVRNLLDKEYPELRAGGFVDPGQPRSAYGTLKYNF